MIIAVDFDGTIIEPGWYPEKGPFLPHSITVLKYLQAKGHKLILSTCRDGISLELAVKQCMAEGVKFDAVNKNISPMPHLSTKVCANMYIGDDAWPCKPINWREIGESFGMTDFDFEKE